MYSNFRAPVSSGQFHRRWEPSVQASPIEVRLSQLRSAHGNIEGTRIFREELAAKKGAWL